MAFDDTYLLEDEFETQMAEETQVADLPESHRKGFTSIRAAASIRASGLAARAQVPCRGFTSIRAASIRASGLSARSRGASHGLSPTSSDVSSLEQQTPELDGSSLVGHVSKSGRKCDDCNTENERNSNRYKIPCSAVRKLFGEDQDAEVDKINQKDDNHDSLACLSYANSPEAGELSQAHALEVVDRLLDLSFTERDEGFGKKVEDVHKPKGKGVSAAKGSRDLAKRSTLQNAVGEGGMYDWDDDDGGGEFFDNEGPKPRCKSKSLRDTDKEEKPCTKTRLYSNSGLLHKTRSKQNSLHGEEVIKNLEQQLQLDAVSGHNCTDKNTPDTRDTTQMAAEAMGDSCFEPHLSGSNKSGDSSTEKTSVDSEEHLAYSSINVGVVSREAKAAKRMSTRNSSLSQRKSYMEMEVSALKLACRKRKNAVIMTIQEVRRLGLTRLLNQSSQTSPHKSDK